MNPNGARSPFYGSSFTVSPVMQAVCREAHRIAVHPEPVLIIGETGVGKSSLARYIHAESDRASNRFVYFDCVGLDDDIVKREIFGEWNDDQWMKNSLANEANGGSLFLSNVDELPHKTQGELLRLLDKGEFFPVGSTEPHRTDLRFISSAGLELPDKLDGEKFRADLYYSMSTYTLRIPPLRERREEIPALVRSFVQEAAGATVPLDAQVLEPLMRYPWPGNILELRNAIFQASERAGNGPLLAAHLPPWVLQPA